MIIVENVTRTFGSGAGKPALKKVTAKIEAGRVTGLVGPDGAGKTTLLRLFCGLLLPGEGRVSVLGLDTVAESGAIHARVGYMPQRFGLYEDLSVMENLNLQADLRNVPPKERKARYAELLSFTKLEPFTNRLAGRLSGGMKQKLGLACTLLSRPPVLLLDEPGVGVDPVARKELWQMVRQLLTPDSRDSEIQGTAKTIVWSTSYLDEAEVCDSVLLLNEGELLYDGPPGGLSARVKGRVFLVEGAGKNLRALVAPMMRKRETLDVVIQGSKVRVVTRDDGTELRESLNDPDGLGRELPPPARAELVCRPAEPRFEDAFMDILGGARSENPAVTSLFGFPRASDRAAAVEARNLVKRYGTFTAVGDVSFAIRRGEIFGLLGPNGAGKSTIFKMLCGLTSPTSGECFVAGADFREAPGTARSRLGYMAQKFSLYGELSVKKNLDFFSGAYGLSGAARKEIVERVIEAFDLSWCLKTPALSLPLGFKQRLAMSCAIMHGPDVLFLDEPTSGVDPVTRREFWTYINNAALKGVTVLVTTHFMDEAEYCDRIALIYKGKIAVLGTPDAVKAGAGENAAGSDAGPTLEDAFIKVIERADSAEEGTARFSS
ncbi:MAG: ATP-binding cassette domain-containing protein [Synergistaceae bacterium]|jgi:ABC-2 type transport system ATP-binding protein|nr:ATP-binding cassette domain-containing protein [Synergistaceae bacterium]